jgi:predicted hydrocarbon binding protein
VIAIPAPVTLSNRLFRFFVDSATQEVGADKFPSILAEDHLSPLMPALTDKVYLAHLDGVEAAVLYASLQQALRQYYGRGARGILLRIGEGMWSRMMAQANLLEKAEMEIVRRLPVPARRRRILELLADTLRNSGGAVSVHTLDMDLLLVDHSAAATQNQTSTDPICFVTRGLIQAALFWATGQEADMEEIACKAAGAPACEFKIKLGVPSK